MGAIATPINPASVLSRTFWQLAGDQPDPEDAVEVALCAAQALEALERTDRPKITASSLSFLLRLEADRVYASPEQARGDTTSQRSLVFTVGVLVFEKLTGYHPFGATQSRPTTNDAVDEAVPAELRAVLETAMAPFPADRWSSLHALRDELNRFVGNQGTLVAEAPRFRPRTVPPPCPGSAVRRVVGSRPDLATEPPRRLSSVATPPPTPRAEPEPPLVDVSLLEEPDRRSAFARSALLIVCGAAVALAGTWYMQRSGSEASATPVTEPQELPALVVEAEPEPVPEPEPVLNPVILSEARSAESKEPEPESTPVLQPETTVFSPDVAGDNALESMRNCFDDARIARGVELSASVRFGKSDGLSNRVYYAPDQQLSTAERDCVRTQLTGISGGAVPARNTMVNFTFWLSSERGRFWSKIQG